MFDGIVCTVWNWYALNEILKTKQQNIMFNIKKNKNKSMLPDLFDIKVVFQNIEEVRFCQEENVNLFVAMQCHFLSKSTKPIYANFYFLTLCLLKSWNDLFLNIIIGC